MSYKNTILVLIYFYWPGVYGIFRRSIMYGSMSLMSNMPISYGIKLFRYVYLKRRVLQWELNLLYFCPQFFFSLCKVLFSFLFLIILALVLSAFLKLTLSFEYHFRNFSFWFFRNVKVSCNHKCPCCECPADIVPVCGTNGKQYSNECYAKCAWVYICKKTY